MAETPRQVIRRPDGQPYSPGTITDSAYVLKSTDRWLPDVGPDGAIWSGAFGRIKSNQHPARSIVDTDGTVLRPPQQGGEDPPVRAAAKISRSDRRTAALRMAGVDSHLYVVGEREEGKESKGPVKIGMKTGGVSRTGRGGINVGNWRRLYVEDRWFIPFEDLRWTEWIIHKRLTPWHVRGEWFDVRAEAAPCGWKEFLSRSATGDIPRCNPWRLGSDDHHLVRMRRLATMVPRQFDAECACGEVVEGGRGVAMTRVMRQFALDHLHFAPTDAAVVELTRRQ